MPTGVLIPVSSMSRRFSIGMVHVLVKAGELEFGIHFRDQLLVGHLRAPLAARFEHHRGVVHVQGRVVCRAVGPADGAEHARHLGEGAKDPVLLLQQLRRLADRDSGKRRGHVQGSALK
jgi:hypothetical protein